MEEYLITFFDPKDSAKINTCVWTHQELCREIQRHHDNLTDNKPVKKFTVTEIGKCLLDFS